MGSIGFLPDFESYMATLGVGRCPIGFVAAFAFKTSDSGPDSSNTVPISIDFDDVGHFQKSCHVFLARYLSCFGPGRSKSGFLSFPIETKKVRDEKLRRIVVVSPREVPSLAFSCPFKIFNFRPFLKVRSLFRSQKLEKSVH